MKYAVLSPEFQKILPYDSGVIGAKIIEKGNKQKAIIAIQEGANKIIRIVDVLEYSFDVFQEIIEKGTPLFRKIESFFNDIFNHLPTYIDEGEFRYQLALFPVRGKAYDMVAYVRLFDNTGVFHVKPSYLYITQAKTLFKAKNKMHERLESEGIL